jgi:hypothetical protein
MKYTLLKQTATDKYWGEQSIEECLAKYTSQKKPKDGLFLMYARMVRTELGINWEKLGWDRSGKMQSFCIPAFLLQNNTTWSHPCFFAPTDNKKYIYTAVPTSLLTHHDDCNDALIINILSYQEFYKSLNLDSES